MQAKATYDELTGLFDGKENVKEMCFLRSVCNKAREKKTNKNVQKRTLYW